MKKTLVKIGSVLIITALMSTVTVAEEKTAVADDNGAKVKKLETLGAARARLQQTVQDVLNLNDANNNGFNVKAGEITRNYETAYQLFTKAIQQEQAKPAAEQNAEQLQVMINERQNLAQLWSKYSSIDKVAIDAKISVAWQRYAYGVNPVFTGLIAMDSGWTKLNLDSDPLKTMYELVEKSAVEIKAQQQAALAEMDIQMKFWQDALTNATSRCNAWIGTGK